MNNLYIYSNLEFDKNKIKEILNETFSYNFNILMLNNNETYIPPQTINSGGLFTINDKINDMLKIIDGNEAGLIIHNSIKTQNNKLIDYISLSFIFNKNKYTESGEEIEINFTILERYPKFKNIIDDLKESYISTNKNFIYDGCNDKLSDIIEKYYNISDYWTKEIFDISNTSRISNILLKIILKNIKLD